MPSNFKTEPRVRNPELLKALHLRWKSCALCGSTGKLSLHHIIRHPRDDVVANLVMLCGSGTTGCHGKIEARDANTQRALGQYLLGKRPETVSHIAWRLGSLEAAESWFQRMMNQ